ncbi:hypothetical protein V5799_023839 [Amblyomma americanum]|uniref:Uncharacterized protein n=1 Tax=Amblyomma americanum TaxID=6943 RepID=A0AAQ4FIG7_AMBAM
MFASTMGVMVYMGEVNHTVFKLRDRCIQSYMTDMQIMCTTSGMQLRHSDDAMSAYAYEPKGKFVCSYEDESSLKTKFLAYMLHASDGWALYNVEHDVYWDCQSGNPYERVKLAYDMAKARRVD